MCKVLRVRMTTRGRRLRSLARHRLVKYGVTAVMRGLRLWLPCLCVLRLRRIIGRVCARRRPWNRGFVVGLRCRLLLNRLLLKLLRVCTRRAWLISLVLVTLRNPLVYGPVRIRIDEGVDGRAGIWQKKCKMYKGSGLAKCLTTTV